VKQVLAGEWGLNLATANNFDGYLRHPPVGES